MQLAMIGIARMGGIRRLPRSGHSAKRKQHGFAEKTLSAIRAGLGGHKETQQHKNAARKTAPDIVKPKANRS